MRRCEGKVGTRLGPITFRSRGGVDSNDWNCQWECAGGEVGEGGGGLVAVGDKKAQGS